MPKIIIPDGLIGAIQSDIVKRIQTKIEQSDETISNLSYDVHLDSKTVTLSFGHDVSESMKKKLKRILDEVLTEMGKQQSH